jgi:nucleoside-triphosphatase
MNGSKHILVTGLPGVGKTTLVVRVATELEEFHPAGFYTVEMRERGQRKGFELVSLNGHRALLSHVDIRSSHRVGRYGVDVEGFDQFLGMIAWADPDTGILVIDEIGKMECFSARFRALVRRALDSNTPVLATIALRGGGLIAEAKNHKDAELLKITQRNRDELADVIIKRLVS